MEPWLSGPNQACSAALWDVCRCVGTVQVVTVIGHLVGRGYGHAWGSLT